MRDDIKGKCRWYSDVQFQHTVAPFRYRNQCHIVLAIGIDTSVSSPDIEAVTSGIHEGFCSQFLHIERYQAAIAVLHHLKRIVTANLKLHIPFRYILQIQGFTKTITVPLHPVTRCYREGEDNVVHLLLVRQAHHLGGNVGCGQRIHRGQARIHSLREGPSGSNAQTRFDRWIRARHIGRIVW